MATEKKGKKKWLVVLLLGIIAAAQAASSAGLAPPLVGDLLDVAAEGLGANLDP